MKIRKGPDPNFPYLSENDRFHFPSPENWTDNIIAVGGNLSPGMLISAYEQGIFPWYNPEDPILWQSPDPRMVIFPETLHVSKSMLKIFKKEIFKITLNHDFSAVIHACGETERPAQDGTWITEDIIKAYTELHRLGWAYSTETYHNGELVGGCYGVRIGRAFCAESMFHKKDNASKAALIGLAQYLFINGVKFFDCQVPSDHLRSLGGIEMCRRDFLKLLKQSKT